jgi:hypothetical protein
MVPALDLIIVLGACWLKVRAHSSPGYYNKDPVQAMFFMLPIGKTLP